MGNKFYKKKIRKKINLFRNKFTLPEIISIVVHSICITVWFVSCTRAWRLKHTHTYTQRQPRMLSLLCFRSAYIGSPCLMAMSEHLASSPPETTPLPSGTHEGLMLRAAASIGKQVVYSGRQGAIESSGCEGLQLPTASSFLYN